MSKKTRTGQASQNRPARKPSARHSGQKSASKRQTWIIAGLVLIALLLIGLGTRSVVMGHRIDAAFQQALQRGRGSLRAVETLPDEGNQHVAPGEPVSYSSDPPTSGPHDPTPTEPGFYSRPHRSENLVHSLEHGIIVIYYDEPGSDVLKTLHGWASLYTGQWDGIIVTPKAGLGKTIILTAWTKRLRLDPFNADTAAAFIDAYRGRGPENPVR
jgi:hypothetical protein